MIPSQTPITDVCVLYVEDEPRSRRVMNMTLKARMGLSEVHIFEDSENFLERVKALSPQPQVVFLDIHVPPHDGFQMLEMLRQTETFADVPVIALTASVMNEEVDRLMNAGFDGCLGKPIDIDTFPEHFEAIIRNVPTWQIMS